ncbi:hypothetical protein GUJ93_ZPchr0001g29912 [Zizania palustris]|uniref:Vacuolar protein-sorting-associated protein 36 n=1 Tax=Zizania palustris TaxID=103762 RepID=A0A8J5V2P9_ZIZPA|nr:hypothetical protein GUJ93_ZPchr0001g29912 [Zizania palustris]
MCGYSFQFWLRAVCDCDFTIRPKYAKPPGDSGGPSVHHEIRDEARVTGSPLAGSSGRSSRMAGGRRQERARGTMSGAAADWLSSADVTAAGRPVLSTGEMERHLVAQADLEPEESPRLAPFRGCLLVLTSHRLIFLHENSRFACALPLAAIVHSYPPHHLPAPSRSEVVAIVVFGKGDADVFYGRLLEAIRARAWKVTPVVAPAGGASVAQAAPAEDDLAIKMPVVGVSGILRMEQEAWESAGQNLQDAFQYLSAQREAAEAGR